MLDTGSTPQVRGILAFYQYIKNTLGITPAYAGNTHLQHRYDKSREDHPRSRGEYTRQTLMTMPQEGSPPLARGILPIPTNMSETPRITPARAGNTLSFI